MKVIIGEVDIIEYGRELFYIFRDNFWSIYFNGDEARIIGEPVEDTDLEIKNPEVI